MLWDCQYQCCHMQGDVCPTWSCEMARVTVGHRIALQNLRCWREAQAKKSYECVQRGPSCCNMAIMKGMLLTRSLDEAWEMGVGASVTPTKANKKGRGLASMPWARVADASLEALHWAYTVKQAGGNYGEFLGMSRLKGEGQQFLRGWHHCFKGRREGGGG